MILAVCMNATVTLEQPRNSFLEYYPRWRDFLDMLRKVGGVNAVPCFIYGQVTNPNIIATSSEYRSGIAGYHHLLYLGKLDSNVGV